MTVLALPTGITADKSALWGLLALNSNLNAFADGRSTITTAGTASVATAAQVISGCIILASGASGGFTLTLPATATLISGMGPTIPTDGTFSFPLRIKNDSVGQIGTVTAGDSSTTLNGTMTIATATTRVFLVTVASATTITIDNLGSMSL